jgi:hypothetical protein
MKGNLTDNLVDLLLLQLVLRKLFPLRSLLLSGTYRICM